MDALAGGVLSAHARRISSVAMVCLIASCGGGGGGGSTGSTGGVNTAEQETINGLVIGAGLIQNAVVCADANANARCDLGETRTRSDANGAYALSVPKNSAVPLIAELNAGEARDADQAGFPVDASYRMVSPSDRYSTSITPYTTMVYLSGETDLPLAEDETRNTLGLPPKFDMKLTAAGSAGSMSLGVARAIVTALKTAGTMFDLSSADALAEVVAAFPPGLTDLPQLRINTRDAAPIVSKEVYVDATFQLTNPAVSDQAVALNGKIRGRGHSTWGQPKNPYKVQFSNDAAYAAIPDFLGMKKNRNWALLADYFDRSLMRNKLAFSLASSNVFSDGLKWNPSGQHVEVYLNDAYVGVYLLTEDIRIDPARLNIKKMSASATVNDIDGGYIVEVDNRLDCFNDGVLNLQLVTGQGVPVCIDTPDEGSITQNQLAYIKGMINGVEQDLYGRNSMEKINPVSFADWYLIQELFRNNDAAFFSSDFMWKDTAASAIASDRLLNMGPIWDFDLSAGNVNYFDNWKTEGCWVSKALGNTPSWMPRLFDNAEFLNLVLSRWKQKRPALAKFINTGIATYARRLEVPQQRNFAVWPIFSVPLTNYYVFSSHAEEVAFVKTFLNQRMAWLDQAFATTGSFNALCK